LQSAESSLPYSTSNFKICFTIGQNAFIPSYWQNLFLDATIGRSLYWPKLPTELGKAAGARSTRKFPQHGSYTLPNSGGLFFSGGILPF
jgi:hypothetical protein